MKKFQMFLKNLVRDERGQDLVEYALMAGFVAVAAGAIMPGVAPSVAWVWQKLFVKSAAVVSGTIAVATEASDETMAWMRLTCAVLAIILLAVIVFRRKKSVD